MAKTFLRAIYIPEAEVKTLQDILNITEGASEDYGRDEVIDVRSTVFLTPYGKFGVDIKTCNGDTPYVDPVLFEILPDEEGVEIWHELFPLDVDDTILGDYVFSLDKEQCGEELELTVRVIEGNAGFAVKVTDRNTGIETILDGLTSRRTVNEFIVEDILQPFQEAGIEHAFEFETQISKEYQVSMEKKLKDMETEINELNGVANRTPEQEERLEVLSAEIGILSNHLYFS